MLPKTFRVNVTKKDIQEGLQGDPGSCAIALAIQRAYPRYTYISATTTKIKFADQKDRVHYEMETPSDLAKWISQDFDHKTVSQVRIPPSLELPSRRIKARPIKVKKYDRIKMRRDRIRRKRELSRETPAEREKREQRAKERTQKYRDAAIV